MSAVDSKDKLPYIEWADDAGALQRLYPDVDESEEASLPAELTKNPVEEGADATDHYRPIDHTVELRWFFAESGIRGDLGAVPGREQIVALKYPPSRAPDFSLNSAINAVGALLGFGETLPTHMKVFKFDRAPGRYAEALGAINDIRDNGRLCKVSTSSVIYEDMMLTNANPKRGAEEGDGARISFTFEHVNFVRSDVALAVPVEARAVTVKKVGTQGTDTDLTANAGDRKSLLKRALDSFGGH